MEWTMQEFTEELAMAWLKKPCWSIAEAVFLLGETQIPVSKLAGNPLPPEFAGNAGNDLDSLIRAIIAQQLKPIANTEGSIRGRFPLYSPADVIHVAEEINFGNWKNWKSRLEAINGADTKQSQAKTSQKEINQEWQTKLESMANELISQGQKPRATKGALARKLGKEIKVDQATIERRTRKTWR